MSNTWTRFVSPPIVSNHPFYFPEFFFFLSIFQYKLLNTFVSIGSHKFRVSSPRVSSRHPTESWTCNLLIWFINEVISVIGLNSNWGNLSYLLGRGVIPIAKFRWSPPSRYDYKIGLFSRLGDGKHFYRDWIETVNPKNARFFLYMYIYRGGIDSYLVTVDL